MTDDDWAVIATLAGAFALCVSLGMLAGAWFG